MHEIMRDAAGAGARGQLAGGYSFGVESALAQECLWHDNDLMPRQRRADDRMRTGDIVGKTIARRHFNAAAVLLEIGDAAGLEQDLEIGMFA